MLGLKSSAFNFTSLALAAAGVTALFAVTAMPSRAAEDAVVIPAPKTDVGADATSPLQGDGLKTIVLAGGCFWGVQGVYQHTKGVTQAVSGYAGKSEKGTTYDLVSSGTTGNAEAVKITYNPKEISYGKLLQIYFSVVQDPTQLNRQGPDHGTQYRSAIFTSSPEEKKVAENYISQLNAAKVYSGPIVTAIEPMTAFYPAESYHQDYLTLHPYQPYIAINDLPKVENLKKLFATEYREKPVLVREARVTN